MESNDNIKYYIYVETLDLIKKYCSNIPTTALHNMGVVQDTKTYVQIIIKYI